MAALVLLAGPAVPMEQVLRHQTRVIAALQGAPRTGSRRLMRRLRPALPPCARRPTLPRPAPAHGRAGPVAARGAQDLCRRSGHALGFDAARHDPLALIGAFDGPVLALYGGSDTQVDATENAAALRDLARTAGMQVDVMAGLNHLFQADPTGDPQNYARIAQTLAPEVPARIVAFLRRAVG
ncbi:hypothetical protein [Rhodobacter capsulatus]|uniref:hypothetical protein n=1 Tax=Rhodobacter capsulatus TaxID=1061 RepID=UPI0040288198